MSTTRATYLYLAKAVTEHKDLAMVCHQGFSTSACTGIAK